MRYSNRPSMPDRRYRRYASTQPVRRRRGHNKIVLFAKRVWGVLATSARFAYKALMMILLPGPIENKTNEIYHDRTRWMPRDADRK